MPFSQPNVSDFQKPLDAEAPNENRVVLDLGLIDLHPDMAMENIELMEPEIRSVIKWRIFIKQLLIRLGYKEND